jgi:probable HAF family extracellular repeat protein
MDMSLRMLTLPAATILALALGGVATPAAAAASHALRITDLGVLAEGEISQAVAVNDHGEVAGSSLLSRGSASRGHAFLWRDGRMTDLGTLGGQNSYATDVNNHGDVVGTSDTSSGNSHAFIWRDGRMTDVGTLGGADSFAEAINDRGEVVGTSYVDATNLHAFSWSDGTIVDLGTLPGGGFSRADDVNDHGVIGGDSDYMHSGQGLPTLWYRGQAMALTYQDGWINAINNRGQAIGGLGNGQAFFYDGDRFVDLGALTYSIQPSALNDRGQVVGSYPNAFLLQDGVVTALPLLAAGNAWASSINNHGQIAGAGMTPSGDLHALLWTR